MPDSAAFDGERQQRAHEPRCTRTYRPQRLDGSHRVHHNIWEEVAFSGVVEGVASQGGILATLEPLWHDYGGLNAGGVPPPPVRPFVRPDQFLNKSVLEVLN